MEFSEIVRALRRSGTRNGRDGVRAVAQQVGTRYADGACSGRAALAVLLGALHGLRPGRDVVAIPAYTCFTVAASVVRAGLKVLPVEVDPETLDFDWEALARVPGNGLLAVLTSNLFGLVNDVSRAKQMASQKGAFLVDDAAQALGAMRDGRAAGTQGDAGIYSLGRGKALAAMEGGIIVTDSEPIAQAVAEQVAKLPETPKSHNANLTVQMLAYMTLLHPRLYWLPNSLPFLRLGTTEFDPGFVAAKLAALPNAFLSESLTRLETVNAQRRAVAKQIATALEGCAGFRAVAPAAGSAPSYTRFPVLADSEARRDHAVERLRAAGIGASAFYPSAICDIESIGGYLAPGSQHCPRAESISSTLLTLPCHPYVQPTDVREMASILEAA